MLARMHGKGNPPTLLVGMQAGAATVENSMEVLKKMEIELPCEPAIALLGMYPKDINVVIQRGTCTPMFIAATSTVAKLEGAEMSFSR